MEAIEIRPERAHDQEGIALVNRLAFGSDDEARLVERLRAEVRPYLSLVACEGTSIVGHIVFSPVTIEGVVGPTVVGLGPMAVAPTRQRCGIGSRLARAGLELCEHHGMDAVVVLGHPELYPRYGFVPARRFALRYVSEAFDEAFFALELRPGALASASGLVHYSPPFDVV